MTTPVRRRLRPGVCALESLGAEPARREEQVADCMGRLHRGDDAELSETTNLGGGKHLGVLVAPARLLHSSLGLGHGLERFRIEVEQQPMALSPMA